jgi:hypothetical protein
METIHETVLITSYTPAQEEAIMNSGKYYVYYWKDIDETIVYIGKGCRRRNGCDAYDRGWDRT